ncbi:MAG TPA: type I glyceraldehyde-3-phosphate dehydrogenase [Nitrospiria bacterium]|nr:type I glyceraldehyde-3-phosphate dehydrogenase [Nitrospiria bacterium]
MAVKVAINGFGRIGRNLLRASMGEARLEWVAINDLTDANTLAHLFRHDSVHGRYQGEVEAKEGGLVINGRPIAVLSERDPSKLPWKAMGAQIVVESTGRFVDRAGAGKHLEAGASRVIISAPAKEPDLTVVMGVNEAMYKPAEHRIVSNASCTTNCLAPVAKVLLDHLGIRHGLMTTIHSYTNDQQLLDLPHKDLRRARAAALSMIPTTTGAAKALGLVLPALKGRMDGMSIRVPTPNVSLIDLVAEVERDTTDAEVNGLLKQASEQSLKGILSYTDDPLVSIDFNGNPSSAIVDGGLTRVMDRRMVKVLAWYDNEWGYSNRLKELLLYMADRL